MTDPQRMKEHNEAWKLINSASHEEREELFKRDFQKLDEHKARFDEPENRFNPYSHHAYRPMRHLETFFQRLTGYRASWIPDKFLEHCSDNAGRRAKYSRDTRETNCVFIALMVDRGSSETQAMKLLMRLRGDAAMTSGQLRELQDSYRDFKKVGRPTEEDLSIEHNAFHIADFLEFSIINLNGEEKASLKAVEAFRALFQELIDLMKSNHETIAKRDQSYPEIFGCVIEWVNSKYEDPLDYFYTHDTHHTVSFHQRSRALNEYINTIYCYLET